MLRTDFIPVPELYPFESRWFDGPVGRMHYLDEGEGQPILLVHGNPTWSFLYRKLIPQLTALGFRCLVPDLLGYGLSEHPRDFGFTAKEQVGALLALVQALELEDLIVMGQDWGGPIGLGVAVRSPESIRGLVLGSTFAWRAGGITRCIGHVLRWGATQRWMIQGEGFIERVMGLARTNLTKQELSHYQLVAATPELRRAKAVLPRELLDAEDWLSELERDVVQRLSPLPTLVIHAKKDAFSGGTARRLGKMLPNHVVLVLPEAGHFFQEDAPREVARAIGERFDPSRAAPG